MLPFSTKTFASNQESLASSPDEKTLLFTNAGDLYLSKQTDAGDFLIASLNENDSNFEMHGSERNMTVAAAVEADDIDFNDYLP